jgi:hypothetical protein
MAQFAKIGDLIINLDQVLLAHPDDFSNTQGYRVVFALCDPGGGEASTPQGESDMLSHHFSGKNAIEAKALFERLARSTPRTTQAE